MKEFLHTVKFNLTQATAEKKISKMISKKIVEVCKTDSELAKVLNSDLNDCLEIIKMLYSDAPLEKVEEMYYKMDTAARDDFYTFCKVETENHKPFFSGCMSIDDVKMKLIRDKNFRYTEEFNGLNFKLFLFRKDYAKSLQLPLNCYNLSTIKEFCYEILNELKIK